MSFYDKYGLVPVINASGTMTWLGASSVNQTIIDAVAECAPYFVEMARLQACASAIISRLCGTDAGCVTACVAAGISVSVAACMTGDDLSLIEQLPDTAGMKDQVLLMKGHSVNFGARISQMIRIAGADVVEIGDATRCTEYQLRSAIGGKTAAAVYVVSHHTVQGGQLPLATFASVCHQYGVPVIVDAASEYDLRRFTEAGADLVLYSGHKFLAGLTAGIIAGRKELVRAAYLQEQGLGRPMKVGKEGIVGVMAALEQWELRDHGEARHREEARVRYAIEYLRDIPGLGAESTPDPTGNPITRVRVTVDPAVAGLTAAQLVVACMSRAPRVVLRDDELDLGRVLIDPCNMTDENMKVVCDRIKLVCAETRERGTVRLDESVSPEGLLARWPDV
jgi:D-glucosaminate-6-phosphate ammonia-lyase